MNMTQRSRKNNKEKHKRLKKGKLKQDKKELMKKGRLMNKSNQKYQKPKEKIQQKIT